LWAICAIISSVQKNPIADERMQLWATIGSVDNPPDRLDVMNCEHCGCLIEIDRADRHSRWHRGIATA
jgi:hypothetical protein